MGTMHYVRTVRASVLTALLINYTAFRPERPANPSARGEAPGGKYTTNQKAL